MKYIRYKLKYLMRFHGEECSYTRVFKTELDLEDFKSKLLERKEFIKCDIYKMEIEETHL